MLLLVLVLLQLLRLPRYPLGGAFGFSRNQPAFVHNYPPPPAKKDNTHDHIRIYPSRPPTFLQVSLTPIESPDGTSVLRTIVDVTERKRAEERLRLVIEAAPR